MMNCHISPVLLGDVGITHDPLPSVQTTDASHPTECETKDTSKSTSEDGTTKEYRHSLIDLFLPCQRRPHTQSVVNV